MTPTQQLAHDLDWFTRRQNERTNTMRNYYIDRENRYPQFYKCGICSCYHPATWDEDCRDDANRFYAGQLDEKYGEGGWVEVEMPA